MKKTIAIIALVVLVIVGTLGGWVLGRLSAFRGPTIPETCAEAEKLRWVKHADVVADFRRHVEHEHDTRFLSVFGLSFSTEFPGLDDSPEMQRLVQEYGARRIEGTTDILTCIEQHELQDQVFHYATHYNNMILGYRERPK